VGIVPNPELRQKLQAAREGLVPGVNVLGLAAGLAAYRDGQPWLDQVLTYLEANRDALCRYVAERMRGVRVASPEATYLAWLDCRESGIEGNPYEFFLQRARVATNDGAAFGRGGDGFVRFNFGCPRSLMLQALDRMSQALQKRGAHA
jgi:cystathionine beta-lyase